jgi:hypothetical protein
VVKSAYSQYLKTYLEKIVMPQCGTCAGLQTRHCIDDVDMDLLVFVFCDKDRHYFISSCSSLSATQQLDDVDTDADLERLMLTIHQPKAASIYYRTCGKIDQHNRC